MFTVNWRGTGTHYYYYYYYHQPVNLLSDHYTDVMCVNERDHSEADKQEDD